MSLFSRPC